MYTQIFLFANHQSASLCCGLWDYDTHMCISPQLGNWNTNCEHSAMHCIPAWYKNLESDWSHIPTGAELSSCSMFFVTDENITLWIFSPRGLGDYHVWSNCRNHRLTHAVPHHQGDGSRRRCLRSNETCEQKYEQHRPPALRHLQA